MNKVQKQWDKTKGYKTKSGAILYLLFELFQKLFPETLTDDTEQVVKYTIDLMILTGGVDWVWRNRKEILQWVKNIFVKKQK